MAKAPKANVPQNHIHRFMEEFTYETRKKVRKIPGGAFGAPYGALDGHRVARRSGGEYVRREKAALVS